MSAPYPAITRKIVTVVFFSFIAYLTIGIPLAALPTYVQSLGFGPFIAGIAISVQYLATFMSRAAAGRTADGKGPKRTVITGLFLCGTSGLFGLIAALLASTPWLCLTSLLIGRLCLGCGESFVGTGAIMWGVGRVGINYTARIISWNGIATYGALAIGAPLGMALERLFGFSAIGWSVVLLTAVGIPIAFAIAPTIPIVGKPIPIHLIFGRVLPFGMGLALGSIGFGSIATFITLYYQSHHWADAALCLSLFGFFFIGVRLLFGSTIDRYGGYRVAIISLAVESIGLFILWRAGSVQMALLGATITGIGFSLVFPSLGVESVSKVTPDNRGAALAIYSVFVDVALGTTGPVGGFIATHFDFNAVFLFAMFSALAALALVTGVFLSSRALVVSESP